MKRNAHKLVEGSLRVHAWQQNLPNTQEPGFLSAGVMDLDEDGGAMSAAFRYDEAYLAAAGSYALDPINMPLSRTAWQTNSQFVHLGAIFDAAPDAWGRKVVTTALEPEDRSRVFRGAFLRGADGIGALILTPANVTDQSELNAIVQLSLAERPALSQIEQAAQAARGLERGADLNELQQQMLAGSWTIGGARPKAILRDDSPGAHAHASLIAKFSSAGDTIDRNRVEYACLQMAHDMGFNVPERRLLEVTLDGNERASALLLERFDRFVDEAGQMQRQHYISAMSLASYQPKSPKLDSRMDVAIISCSRMIDLAARVCSKPAQAKVEMFARLALNAALQNTDDHLKNFGFRSSRTDASQYEIAPVFDVSSQAAPRHYLHLLDKGQVYTAIDLLDCARQLGISKGAAAEVIDRIEGTLSRCSEFLDEAGLNHADAVAVEQWIVSGLGKKPTSSVAKPPIPGHP